MKIELNIHYKQGEKIGKPLADFRPTISLEHFIPFSRLVIKNTIAIGISPRDEVLDVDTHQTINNNILKIFKRRHIPVTLVGEYSPDKHRWHYHGFCKIQDMKQLDSLKRSLTRQIGRTVSEQIRNETDYIDYITKMYREEIVNHSIQPWLPDSYITNMTVHP